MINNLSSDLDVMRPDLLPTSLEVLSYNINRRNTDLKFFEKNFEGILPLEISVNTNRKNGVLSLSTLNRIDKMERMIAAYPEFSIISPSSST